MAKFVSFARDLIFVSILKVWIRMENESQKSEVQSQKLIRIKIKKQWFISSESESDLDDSDSFRIRKAFIGRGECEQDYFFLSDKL